MRTLTPFLSLPLTGLVDRREISFNDGDRVFAQIEGQWWGALIVGEKTLGKKGEACYPCRFAWMSEGKSKLIWEKRIKPLSRLYTIDYQVRPFFLPFLPFRCTLSVECQ
jgi:hypothetical protein